MTGDVTPIITPNKIQRPESLTIGSSAYVTRDTSVKNPAPESHLALQIALQTPWQDLHCNTVRRDSIYRRDRPCHLKLSAR